MVLPWFSYGGFHGASGVLASVGVSMVLPCSSMEISLLPWCFHEEDRSASMGTSMVVPWWFQVDFHGTSMGAQCFYEDFHSASMVPPYLWNSQNASVGLPWDDASSFDGTLTVLPWGPPWCFRGASMALPWCFHGGFGNIFL